MNKHILKPLLCSPATAPISDSSFCVAYILIFVRNSIACPQEYGVTCRLAKLTRGSAPTISIDNTAGCQLYLSKDSLEASITTAKSSEVNVLVPASEADGEWGEHALPQQYVHVYKDGQFVTTPVTHSGG
ncbi:cyclase-associated protein 1 [Phtheirospermum japonicum]|uniref:Cyclase-associated protein 1 n=1 Tax=Phtheirospermum japonicum TaxID=374723 RepID=A0A830CJ80_9LAMI|nr:cyclase-associated protein 1 [Phtheirospermum japonicum]